MNEIETAPIEEILEILGKLKPKGQLARHEKTGSGWVCESFFTFGHRGCYYWIVIVDGTFAFKRITCEWIKLYSNLILLSPYVYVEWDICHMITDWAVLQSKG
ncbi:MAG: hypothetical protein AB1510_05585 [Bacillota bacterium]